MDTVPTWSKVTQVPHTWHVTRDTWHGLGRRDLLRVRNLAKSIIICKSGSRARCLVMMNDGKPSHEPPFPGCTQYSCSVFLTMSTCVSIKYLPPLSLCSHLSAVNSPRLSWRKTLRTWSWSAGAHTFPLSPGLMNYLFITSCPMKYQCPIEDDKRRWNKKRLYFK